MNSYTRLLLATAASMTFAGMAQAQYNGPFGVPGTAPLAGQQVQQGNPPWSFNAVPATTGGESIFNGGVSAGVSGVAVSGLINVKATTGQVFDFSLSNPAATVCYLQFFNAASGSVVVGTTTNLFAIPVTGAVPTTLLTDNGWAFSTAISVAPTTTRTGSAACASGIDVTIGYK